LLSTLKDIFEKLNENEVRYVHWKSNEHLKSALSGKTDLDILVHQLDYHKFIEVVNKHGFKKYDTDPLLNYSFIDDFIGFDNNTGDLIHLHTHFQLVIGKKFVKEIHLPIEEYIFKHFIKDVDSGVKIIDPNLEIILLLIRFNIKYEGKFKKTTKLNNEYEIEYNWLINKIDEKLVKEHALNIFDKKTSNVFFKTINHIDKKRKFKQLRKNIFKKTNKYKTNRNFINNIKYYISKVKFIYKAILVKKFHIPIKFRRTKPNSGLIIAFMGVDGAGKSTLVNYTEKWLSNKVDVHKVYFGTGDSTFSLLRTPIVNIKKITNKLKFKNNNKSKKVIVNSKETKSNNKHRNIFTKFIKVIWALVVALEKKNSFKKLWKAKSSGMVVITDRYPQVDIYGFNDGPLLTDWLKSKNLVKRQMSRWEYNVYNLGKFYKPDLVIKLIVSEDISSKRKSDTSKEMITKKIEAIKKIKIHHESNELLLNTEESLEKTKLNLKLIIKDYI